MKYAKFLAVLMLAGFSISILCAYKFYIGPGKKTVNPKAIDGKGFAVLELFTSEGCSSCPPADELMAKMRKNTKIRLFTYWRFMLIIGII